MHKMDLFINHEERDERGQSLVEFVLVLPIILVMIAGVLEVTNIILQFNNVQQAAREGARYAAGGGVDNGVDEVVLDTISNNLDESRVTSIWIVRPHLVVSGVSPYTVTFPAQYTGAPAEWGTDELCVYPKPCIDTASGLSGGDVRLQLQDANVKINADPGIGGTGTRDSIIRVEPDDDQYLVVVSVRYQAQTILNLSFFDYFGPDGTLPLQAWTVMRQEIESETLEKFNSGCNAYPIAVNLQHQDGGTYLYKASEGDVFTLPINSTSGGGTLDGFAFLAWNGTRLLPSYLYNTTDGSLISPNADPLYIDPEDSSDTTLHRLDLIYGSSAGSIDGNIGGVLDDHIDKKRALRIIGYNYSAGANPSTADPKKYQVNEFLIIKVLSYTTSTLEIEFLRLDNSCGYDLE